MAEEKTLVGYAEILAVLAGLCRSNRTGTLFVTTSDKHSVRFVLEDGQIVSCNYSMKRGRDAIPLLKTIKAGSYRFSDGIFSTITEIPLPPTETLLSEIRPTAAGIATSVLGRSPGAATQAPAVAVANMEGILAEAKKELAKHLGPIADMLLEDYFDDNGMPTTGDEVMAFLNAMAGELRDASKAEAFIARMSHITG